LAPHLLGNSYVGTQTALLILAPLPIFYVIYTLGADVLVSSGHTSMRTLIQLAMPAVNILLCWIIVPRYGAIGAAGASVASHALLAATTWSIVGIVVFNHNDRAAPVAGPVATQASEKASSPL
jgi:O-antigen/teichoic acid export membrane protein